VGAAIANVLALRSGVATAAVVGAVWACAIATNVVRAMITFIIDTDVLLTLINKLVQKLSLPVPVCDPTGSAEHTNRAPPAHAYYLGGVGVMEDLNPISMLSS